MVLDNQNKCNNWKIIEFKRRKNLDKAIAGMIS